MYEIALRGGLPDANDLLSKNDMVKLKRCVYAQGAASLPPITTHNIVDDHLGKKSASKKYDRFVLKQPVLDRVIMSQFTVGQKILKNPGKKIREIK